MIHPSIQTLESSSCFTYGMGFCSLPLTSIPSNPFHNSSCPLHLAHTLSGQGCKVAHSLYQHLTTLGRYMVRHQQLGTTPFDTRCLSSHMTNGAICDKYYVGKHIIFHRPDKATLFIMVNACLHSQNILLFKKLQGIIFIIVTWNRCIQSVRLLTRLHKQNSVCETFDNPTGARKSSYNTG